MSWLWDLLLITALAVWAVNWALHAHVPVTILALVLVGLVAFVALARVNGSYSRLIRATFRVAMPLAAIAVFAGIYGAEAAAQLAALICTLFGIYVMFRGFRRTARRRS